MAAVDKRASVRDNYVGVTRTRDGRFNAILRHGGTSQFAGAWATREEAALARDRAILHFGLEDERGLNFPGRARKLGSASLDALRREARLAHMKNRDSKSQYFGVQWTGVKWGARIPLEGKHRHVAHFDDARDAALAYDRAALFYLGSKAVLNFPAEATPASIEEIRRQATLLRKAGSTSKFLGVYWDAARKLWCASLRHANQVRLLGRFEREEDAARAYDYAAWAALGGAAMLNFTAPPEQPPPPLRKRATPRPKVSKYRGVSHNADSFIAQLRVHGTLHNLGTWSEEREAAIAYDRAVLHFGLDKPLNLPKASRRLGPLQPRALQNQARLRQRKLHGKTSYIGVIKAQDRGRWATRVTDASGRSIFAGAFDAPELAAVAYDRVVLHLYGRDVIRNFPERKLQPATAEAMRALAHRMFKEETSSQYRGVHLRKNGRWKSTIMARRVTYHLGAFEVEEEAAEAYDKAAKRLHKKKAKLNFEET